MTGLKERKPREKEEQDKVTELKLRKVREKDAPEANTKKRSPSQNSSSSSDSSVISLTVSCESSFEQDEIPQTPSYSPPPEKKELKKK